MSTGRLPRAKRDYAPWSGKILRAALQNKIGQELKAWYQRPQDLPHRLLTLLIQLEAPAAKKRRIRKSKDCSKRRGGDSAAARRSGTAQSARR